MCGISGVFHKKALAQGLAPVGAELVDMLEPMKHRSMDSSGVTVAGEDCDEDLILSPNPPKDTDGRREGSGRGWVRELQGRWPGLLG